MADLDTAAIATAIAARYTTAVLGTPAGALAIRGAQATQGNQLPPLPAVLVALDAIALDPNAPGRNGTRLLVVDWLARLYYAPIGDGDLEREWTAVQGYAAPFMYAHRANLTLGGLVVACRSQGVRVGVMRYAGVDHVGLEARVRTVSSEAWSPTP